MIHDMTNIWKRKCIMEIFSSERFVLKEQKAMFGSRKCLPVSYLYYLIFDTGVVNG